jgi:hypothetical protein
VPSGGTEFSSSFLNGGYVAANAFDGNTSTNWGSAAGQIYAQTIGYHFASAITVVEVYVRYDTGDSRADLAPKDFYVEFSDDGTTWTSTTAITNQISWDTGAPDRVFAVIDLKFSGNITESLAITNWRIVATRCLDGSLLGTVLSGEAGSSYSIQALTKHACNLTISPKIDYTWTASRVVVLNDYCVPTAPDTTQKLYKATSIGSSPNHTGSTEPTWPSSSTVADGDITWTYIADLVDPKTIGPKIPV